MHARSQEELELLAIIAELRDARFARGTECPRCRSRRIIGWGSFRGRQRYRCRACRRTFSDLTGTPAAYIKKLTCWKRYAECMAASRSVRASAAIVGVNATTTFRWRHRILGERSKLAGDTLTGWIELDLTRFAYSRKGERNVWNSRRRGLNAEEFFSHALVTVLSACDRLGHRSNHVIMRRSASSADLVDALRGTVVPPACVCSDQGPFGPAAVFARRIRADYISGGSPACRVHSRARKLAHVRGARAIIRETRLWIRRFRGVATKYLVNYLAWHWLIDRSRRLQPAAAILRWPMSLSITVGRSRISTGPP